MPGTAMDRPDFEDGGGTDELADWYTRQRQTNPHFVAPAGYKWKGDHYERDTSNWSTKLGRGAQAAGIGTMALGGLGMAGVGPAAGAAGPSIASGVPAGLPGAVPGIGAGAGSGAAVGGAAAGGGMNSILKGLLQHGLPLVGGLVAGRQGRNAANDAAGGARLADLMPQILAMMAQSQNISRQNYGNQQQHSAANVPLQDSVRDMAMRLLR